MLNEVPDHHAPRAPEQVRREKGSERRNENEKTAGRDSRLGQRQNDAAEDRPPRGIEIPGRLDQRPIHPLERHIERQDHEGQIAIDQADHHSSIRVEQFDGTANHAQL